MNIHVKYQIFPFHQEIIKNISFQNSKSVLSFSGGSDTDSLKLVSCQIDSNYSSNTTSEKMLFNLLPQAFDIKKNINMLKWSPNDQYLATACDTMLIYEYKDGYLKEFKNYRDHNLEITAISWSPNSKKVASSSLGNKIVIRDIERLDDTIEKTLNLDIKVVSVIWDPLDKYLVCLCGDNNLIIWRTKMWQKVNSISLSFMPGKLNLNLKREDRKIDWSPDFKYILAPSLDDKIVPVVCALDRQDFQVKFTFMGPFSSINCIKFNPKLYEKENQVISIFAMGDNDGNISIWGLSDKLFMDKPFFLFKSHANGTELIEDLCWNSEGNLLVATTMKKYISFMLFDEGTFGKALSENENQNFREGIYGINTFADQEKKIKVFQNNKSKVLESKNLFIELNNAEIFNGEQNQFVLNEKKDVKIVFTEQKTIIQNGRKKIIPQIQKTLVESINENKIEEEKKEEIPEVLKQKEIENAILIENEIENKSKVVEIIDDSIKPDKIKNIVKPRKKKEKETKDQKDKKSQKDSKENPQKENSIKDTKENNENKEKKILKKKNVVNTSTISQPIQINDIDPENCEKNKSTKDLLISNKEILNSSKKIKDQKKSDSSPKKKIFPLNPNNSQPKVNIINVSTDSPIKEIKPEFPKLIPLQEGLLYNLSNNRVLEFNKKKIGENVISSIRCIHFRNERKELLWTDSLEGETLIAEHNHLFLCFYTTKSLLYINSDSGRRYELPFVVPNLHFIKINSKNDLLLIKNNGELRVFNIETKKNIIEENISFILKENSINDDYFQIENVFIDDNSVPFIYFKTKNVYFYDIEQSFWQKVNNEFFEIGFLQNSNKLQFNISNNLKIKPIRKIDEFFDNLNDEKFNAFSFEKENDIFSIPKIEEKIILFLKKKDFNNFSIISSKYIEKLANLKEINKIRQFLSDLFINKNSKEFLFLAENKSMISTMFSSIIFLLNKFSFGSEIISEIEHFINPNI